MTAIETTTNGRERGRAAPLPSFTFPDSGITVQLRRISPDAQARIGQAIVSDTEWHKLHPKPEPPVQTVAAIDGPMEAPNVDDPAYKKAMSQYLAWMAAEAGVRLLELALRQIVVEVDTEAVAEHRENMAAVGAPLDEDASDRDIYLRQICVSSAYDAAALVAHVQGNSAPTRGAIQASLDMFRHQISEQANL